MKRIYRIPIMGGVKDDIPLKGVEGNPLCCVPLDELRDFPKGEGYGYTCLSYDVDEEWVEIELEAEETVHNWLLALIPQLRDIARDKGWKLDKTELEKTRLARVKPST